MSETEVSAADLDRVVDVINAWAPQAHDAAATSVDPDEPLGRGADGHPPVGGSVDQLMEQAGSLHAVFAASDPQRARELLNTTIRSLNPSPMLGGSGPAWFVDDADIGFAELVLAVWNHARHDFDLLRLGTCGEERCRDAFIDRAQAKNRRYCSDTCQNRVNVRAHRRRHG